MKTNNLPKEWFVKGDGSRLFKDSVIEYLNHNYGSDFIGISSSGLYGIKNGKPYYYNKQWIPDDIIISLQEFIDLTGYTEMAKEKEFKLTQSAILKMAKEGSDNVEKALKAAFPEAFEPEGKSVLVNYTIRDTNITIRNVEEYRDKAFYVDTKFFNWELKRDSDGALCLIPTKK